MSGRTKRSRLGRRGSEHRLLRGYGPLLGWCAAFLTMALLAPTVAPEQMVASSDVGGTGGAGAGGGGAGSTTTTTTAGRGGVGAGGGAGGAGGAGTAGQAATPAGAEECPGPQIVGDPYSPPCRTWGGGDNGGATARGVTPETITIAFRDPGPPYDIGSVITELTGERLTTGSVDRADIIRTYETLVEYFNTRFQFYGRRLELQVFEGQGSIFDEILGGGQSGANADAIQVGQQLGAFADVSIQSPVYADSLAGQQVITTNPIYPSRSFYAERAPYAWGKFPDCTKLVDVLAEFLTKSVVGRPVLAGEFEGEERRLGLVYPESPAYQECGDQLRDLVEFADARQYRLSLDGIPPDARDIAGAFANQGITSVVLASDPLLPYFMTATAEQSDWHPEWITPGVAYQDADFAGQLYEPNQWKRAFGISMLGPTIPARSSYGYAAYRSIDESTSPVDLMVEEIYYQLYVLSIGIQMAGPNLTPDTFAQGMRAYRSAEPVGPQGAWSFPEGEFTAPTDARLIWWDPAATSNYNGQTGAWRDTGERFPFGGLPDGPPAVQLAP